MRKATRYFLLPLMILLVAGLIGCRSDTPPQTDGPTHDASEEPDTPPDNGDAEPPATDVPEPATVSIDLGPAPATLDPSRIAPRDASANDLVTNIFAGLAKLDPDTGLVIPSLALAWETTPDSLTWTVSLRDDVFWMRINPETGVQEAIRPVEANDVVSTIRRACRADTEAPMVLALFIIEGCQEVHETNPNNVSDDFLESTIRARVLNDTTVEFTLVDNPGVFPSVMAMPIMYPQPADLVSTEGVAWTRSDLIWTSGPYAVQSTIPAEEGYTLVANEYWSDDRAGNVKIIQITFKETSRQAYPAWEEGRLDVSAIPEGDLDSIPFDDDPRFRRLVLPATTFITFIYDSAPANDMSFRQALAAALDRDRIINEVLETNGETGIAAQTIMPPGSAAVPRYGEVGVRFDPAVARAALEQAGYGGCSNLPPLVLLTDESRLSQTLATAYVASWNEVLGCPPGQFTVEQQPYPDILTQLSTLPSGRKTERAAMITLSWQADILDAHHWLADILGCRELFLGSFLDQGRECSLSDDRMASAAQLRDVEAREERYTTLGGALFDPDGEMPIIPVYYQARALAIQPWVEVYPIHAGPLQFDRWVVDTSQQP